MGKALNIKKIASKVFWFFMKIHLNLTLNINNKAIFANTKLITLN
jgi:hypothetical protein